MDEGRWSQPDNVGHGRTFVSLGKLEIQTSFKMFFQDWQPKKALTAFDKYL